MKHNYDEKKERTEFEFRPDRLRALADHLENHPLHFKENNQMNGILLGEPGYDTKKSELIVYPIYELIHLFPDEWGIDEEGFPCWIEDSDMNPVSSVVKFFGINLKVLRHLFIPDQQHIDAYGGKRIKQDATPQQIAFNIYELIGQEKAFQIFRMYPINLN